MKKYTTKEFAEGKKAVKIENEEQWNRLNKAHALCDFMEDLSNIYYTNKDSWERQSYLSNLGWEVLEFSQLDFEDEFVVGSWYEFTQNFEKGELYAKFSHKDDRFWYSEKISKRNGFEVKKDWARLSVEPVLVTDLSEIQQYLPEGHKDLIKKDTFVLPEKWYIKSTPETAESIYTFINENSYKYYPISALNLADKITYVCYPKYNDKHQNIGDETYKEITFEQFQQFVLKTTKTMEKEILEYKLKFAEYIKDANTITGTSTDYTKNGFIPDSVAYKKLKEAGVLDLWFEKVYKEEFKVGDWVKLKSNAGGWGAPQEISNTNVKITKIDLRQRSEHSGTIFFDFNGKEKTTVIDKIERLSTPEEIKAAQIQLPTINGYQGSYENGIIKYGCAEFLDSFFINLELSSGVKITKEQIKQIVKYINNNK